jgi:hypothetical protein
LIGNFDIKTHRWHHFEERWKLLNRFMCYYERKVKNTMELMEFEPGSAQ